MFRRDPNAIIEKRGWLFPRYYFKSGKTISEIGLRSYEFGEIQQAQNTEPVLVHAVEASRKNWWLFKGEFYVEDDKYSLSEIRALAAETIYKKERRIKRALSISDRAVKIKSDSRDQIPDDVKIYVWRRDEGKYVKCGSKKTLEFDHIIPFSKGGSDTARNIQILCQNCNREKSDSLI